MAVGRGGTASEYLREHGKNLTIIEVEDQTEALTLVATGKADAAVENMAVAAYTIRSTGLFNVRISGLLDYHFEIYSLVRSDWPLLASILQKAQDSVTEAERAALLVPSGCPLYKDRIEGESAPGATATGPDLVRPGEGLSCPQEGPGLLRGSGLAPHRAHR